MADRSGGQRHWPNSSTLLVVILLVGLVMRLSWPFALLVPIGSIRPAFGMLPGDVPFGFHTDEGHNAVDAWRIASEGWRPVFLERNNGREPLFMYVMAASFSLFGPTIQAARLTGALAGLAAIAAQYLLIQSLPLRRPTRVALLSAAFLAFTFWPVAQARYALRANLLPVWVALMLWTWWHAIRRFHSEAVETGVRSDYESTANAASAAGATGASTSATEGTGVKTVFDGLRVYRALVPIRASLDFLKRSGLAWAALAGLFIGLAVHTHLTGRALPAVLVLSALWVFLRERRPWVLALLATALLTAFMIAWPQIDYFRKQPEMLAYRADQVSVLNPEVNEGDLAGTLLQNAWNLIKMPIFEGDSSWYHNIRHRPVFDDLGSQLGLLLGLFLFAGWLLGRAGRSAQSAAILLVAALGVTLLPSWLSEGAPNYVRLTGIWPTLFLMPALGLDQAAAWIGERRSGIAPLTFMILVPAWLLLTSARDYFGVYAGRPEVYDAFNAAAVERGQTLAGLSPSPIYFTPTLWTQSVIRFLSIERPPQGVFDPGQGIVFPPGGPTNDPTNEPADDLLDVPTDDSTDDPTDDPTAVALDDSRDNPAGDLGSEGAHGNPEPLLSSRYAFDRADMDAAEAFAELWPTAVREDFNGRAKGPLAESINLVTFALANDQVEAILRAIPALDAPVTFGNNLQLERVSVGPDPLQPGAPMNLVLVWKALTPTELDHNFFLRLVSDVDGATIAEFDGPPLGGSYTTNVWNPGERILMPLELVLTVDAPAGPATLIHVWYDWRDGRRLPIDAIGDEGIEGGGGGSDGGEVRGEVGGEGRSEFGAAEIARLEVGAP